jgi:nitrate reductase alpha subunit
MRCRTSPRCPRRSSIIAMSLKQRFTAEPARLLQAIVIDLARDVVEGVSEEVHGVSEEVHIAALPGRFRQDFADRLLEARMVVADDELDAGETAHFQPQRKSRQLDRLSRLASSTARIWRRPSSSTATATSTAWLTMTPASRTFS